MTVAEPHDLLHCTFCAKSQQTVKKLIAGPGVYICDECVDLCNAIIDDELHGSAVDELKRMTARSDALVERLRAEGVPWEEIAEALRRDDAPEE